MGPGRHGVLARRQERPGSVAAADACGARQVLAATKASKIFFLNTMNANNVVDMIKEGVMIVPASQQAAEIGRKYTKRTMPW